MTAEGSPDVRPAEEQPAESAKTRTVENSLQSLMNAFQLLEVLAREPDLTLTELAGRIQLSKASVYRLLSTLQQNGFLRRSEEGKRYRLGLRLWEYGTIALYGLKVRELAMHHLTRLSEECEESVNLSIYDRGDVLFLETVKRDWPGATPSPIALRVPAHCSAAGKVMLAYRSAAEVERYCNSGLAGPTPNTITSPTELRQELAETRERGFAINHGEWHPASCGIAVPLLDHTGEAVAAIGVACPVTHFSPEFIERVAQPAMTRAWEISLALGYREPPATWLAIS